MMTYQIQFDDQSLSLPFNKTTFRDALYVDAKCTGIDCPKGIVSAQRLQLTIHPKQDIRLQTVRFEYAHTITPSSQIFCNGYQSWSESRLFTPDEHLPTLRNIARPFMGYYGDYHIPQIRREKGWLHSWTYTYIRHGEQITLIGSLSEKTALTLLQIDTKQQGVWVEKDLNELHLSHSFPVADVVILQGEEGAVFDYYAQLMQITLPTQRPAIGWTSWYHYYTDISEKIILQNLDAFQKRCPADNQNYDIIFQIDDGYQQKVGDWLHLKDKFPNGLPPIVQHIHKAGYLAGLWVAPFVCEKSSDLFAKHPEWLLKDTKGQLVKAGYNPAWSGDFYVLDFYHQGVQDYLTGVFHTILDKWGFDMVKLDFLYAVGILHRPHKTRGQVLTDAMQFLRHSIGHKRILACGVPLGVCFGLVDYCRIGADIHLRWEHRLLHFLRNRERVSTIAALRSVLGRWQLNRRFFINDPDVFILREAKNKLTPTQQHTILVINALLGSLLFTSDYLEDYSVEQESEFQAVFYYQNSIVQKVSSPQKDGYLIHFSHQKKSYIAYCNLTAKTMTLPHSKMSVELEPYETMVLKKVG